MSALPYEPLRVVPPATETQLRMAWLLRAREAARTALDAARAVPRRAAGYVSRIVHKLHQTGVVNWLRRTIVRLAQPLKTASAALGWTELLAAATSALTSPTGRAALNSAGRRLGKALGWAARKTYSGIDRGLRFFGKPGKKAADKLFAGVVSLGGKLASVAGPVVYRVARLSDPKTTQARLLSGICQSYVIHKLLKAFIPNAWLRLLVEVVLVPAVLDSRLWAWMRRTLKNTRDRAQKLRERAQVLVDLERQQKQAKDEQLLLIPDLEDVQVVTTLQDEMSRLNRAERRAAQRQAKRPN